MCVCERDGTCRVCVREGTGTGLFHGSVLKISNSKTDLEGQMHAHKGFAVTNLGVRVYAQVCAFVRARVYLWVNSIRTFVRWV